MSARAVITIGAEVVVKRFVPPFDYLAEREAAFYKAVPYAAPELVDVGTGFIVTKRLKPALELPGWKPMAQLLDLLRAIHQAGVNHRDVHICNIVCAEDERPLLIDWEHATFDVIGESYDLHGPAVSGVPQPYGQKGRPMWVGVKHKWSVRNAWA